VGFTSKLIKQLSDPDKLKNLADKAQKAVSDNQEQLQGVIGKAGAAVSEKTGGKYDDKIAKVSDAATGAIDKVTTAGAPAADEAGKAPAEAAKTTGEPTATSPAQSKPTQAAPANPPSDPKPAGGPPDQPAAEARPAAEPVRPAGDRAAKPIGDAETAPMDIAPAVSEKAASPSAEADEPASESE
jgi:MT0933-like antitoxin protein